VKTETFRSFDGVQIRYGHQPADGKAQGRVIVVPGRAEFLEKYEEVSKEFAHRGFEFWIMDLRGQGGSQRVLDDPLKGYIDSVDTYVHDLSFFAQNVIPTSDLQTLLLSHSTGGLICMKALVDKMLAPDMAIFISPFFALAGSTLTKFAAMALTKMYMGLGLGQTYLPGQNSYDPVAAWTDNCAITSDPHRYEAFTEMLRTQAHLRLGGVTAGWMSACLDAQSKIREFANSRPDRQPLRMLALFGAEDRIVDARFSRCLMQTLGGAVPEPILQARHELLQENDRVRAIVWGYIDRFITMQDNPK